MLSPRLTLASRAGAGESPAGGTGKVSGEETSACRELGFRSDSPFGPSLRPSLSPPLSLFLPLSLPFDFFHGPQAALSADL